MHQTQDRACKDCKWCRPEKFVFFQSFEMARCAFPVSQATHSGHFTEVFEAKGYCYWERHPLGFCKKQGIYWEQIAQQQPLFQIIAPRNVATQVVAL
jgi:hypothetical protein